MCLLGSILLLNSQLLPDITLMLLKNFEYSTMWTDKGRTIRKVMGGRGIFRLHEFFFLLTTCARFFFSGETLRKNFFSNK